MPIIGRYLSSSPVDPPSSVVQAITSTRPNSDFKPTKGRDIHPGSWELPPTMVDIPVPPPKTTTRLLRVLNPRTPSVIFPRLESGESALLPS